MNDYVLLQNAEQAQEPQANHALECVGYESRLVHRLSQWGVE